MTISPNPNYGEASLAPFPEFVPEPEFILVTSKSKNIASAKTLPPPPSSSTKSSKKNSKKGTVENLGNQKGNKMTVPNKSIPIAGNSSVRNTIYIPPPVNFSVENTSCGSSISPDNHMGQVFTAFQTKMYSLRQFKSGSSSGGSDFPLGRGNVPLSSKNSGSNNSNSNSNSEDTNSSNGGHNVSMGVSIGHVQEVKVIQTGEPTAI